MMARDSPVASGDESEVEAREDEESKPGYSIA